MRITRTLLTSAVVAASVALSAPVACAVDVAALSSSQAKASLVSDARGDDSDNGKDDKDYGGKDGKDYGDKDYGDKDDKDYGGKGDKGYGDKGDHDRKGGHHWKGHKPHGGVHAGGGGLAQSPDTLALGSVLVLGGLGAGAYMLRRRQTSGSAA